MPPKAHRGNKKKNKNNNSPYKHPNQSQNLNHHNLNNNNQKYHNRGRSTSRTRSNRSYSRKPCQRPGTSKTFHKPNTTPPSSTSLASQATHSLRSTLLSSPTGILKRRISLGLSLTLPSSTASSRLKNLLLQAIDNARGCVGKMEFETSCSTPQNTNVDVDVCPGAPKGGAGGGWGDETERFRDSGIGMAIDTDTEEDPWEMEETPVSVDHGCVDVVREGGQLVQRMRWEATERPFGEPPRRLRRMSGCAGAKDNGRLRTNTAGFGVRDDVFGGDWGDEVM